jgi:hypothetical protein
MALTIGFFLGLGFNNLIGNFFPCCVHKVSYFVKFGSFYYGWGQELREINLNVGDNTSRNAKVELQ